MKTAFLLFLTGTCIASSKPLEIRLDPIQQDHKDYGKQLEAKFHTLMEEHPELKARFDEFEAEPRESAGGRYLGYQTRPLLVHQYKEANYQDSGGKEYYKQTIALYFAFGEGFRGGMMEASGVFAIFRVEGHESYAHKADDSFELVKHTVTAHFDGFTKSLEADGDRTDP